MSVLHSGCELFAGCWCPVLASCISLLCWVVLSIWLVYPEEKSSVVFRHCQDRLHGHLIKFAAGRHSRYYFCLWNLVCMCNFRVANTTPMWKARHLRSPIWEEDGSVWLCLCKSSPLPFPCSAGRFTSKPVTEHSIISMAMSATSMWW